MKPYTLGWLAKRSSMARSSLLHYEALGLLVPASRSPTGYRLYGEDEIERLLVIRGYRDAGLSLSAIQELLAEETSDSARILGQRLVDLGAEITRLRAQQMRLAHLLAGPALRARSRSWTLVEWTEMLRGSGFNDEEMHCWHTDFEASDAQAHGDFLRSIGLPADAVADIRRRSRTGTESRVMPTSVGEEAST